MISTQGKPQTKLTISATIPNLKSISADCILLAVANASPETLNACLTNTSANKPVPITIKYNSPATRARFLFEIILSFEIRDYVIKVDAFNVGSEYLLQILIHPIKPKPVPFHLGYWVGGIVGGNLPTDKFSNCTIVY